MRALFVAKIKIITVIYKAISNLLRDLIKTSKNSSNTIVKQFIETCSKNIDDVRGPEYKPSENLP
ncbi:hypothetical protein Sbs19_44530 [Sphingobium sp. BS19]|nr:hypothetical protein Sbs19_44530 [Sphingobium sp. BS19]